MLCFNCKTEMVCVDDVNNIGTRVDFMECPECRAKANIIYADSGNIIDKIEWYRNKGGSGSQFEHLLLGEFLIPDGISLNAFIVNKFDDMRNVITEEEMMVLKDVRVLPWIRIKMICVRKDNKTTLFSMLGDIFAMPPVIRFDYEKKFIRVNYKDLVELSKHPNKLNEFRDEIHHEIQVFKHLFIDFD